MKFYPLFARSVFAFFFLFSSLFCLLAYVPFTYQQVIKGGLIPQLNAYARVEHWAYWVILLVIYPVVGWKRTGSVVWFWSYTGLIGVVQTVHPILPRLENNIASLLWSLAHLVPVLWVAQLGWSRHYPRIRWAAPGKKEKLEEENRRLFTAAWQSALFLAILYACIGWTHRLGPGWKWNAEVFGLMASVLSHFLIFLFFFALLNLLSVIASWFPRPVFMQFLFCHLLGAAVMWLVFRNIVFSAMSFEGTAAQVFAISYSLALTVFLSSICLIRASGASQVISSGFKLAFWIVTERPRSVVRNVFAMLTVAATGWLLVTNAAKLDWNYLVQKLTVVLIWVVAFRLFYVAYMAPQLEMARTGRFLTCALLVLPTYRTYEMSRRLIWKNIDHKITAAQYLDRWTGYDVSFKLIHDSLAPDVADQGFYRFLIQNTNIARSTPIAPVPITLADLQTPSPGKKPNIFMVTVDSMRRDYLSPFNSDVDFTPEIGKFAKESVVMENTFTHYGGTGLSEPSIWVGGMLIHKQYVTPFQPMNSLEKLLQAEKYHAYVSRDTILETVVTPWEDMTQLDEGRGTMDYDLCASLEELTTKIAGDTSGAPLFSYTQPQNLHISVITRQGGKPISNENYRSFYAPYASRLRRIDACFGKFIQMLKARNLYDNSIVVLTADHGDSLGEQGRWGHAYTIYPEIVRIPLIMHVPAALREKYKVDAKQIAFSTDITPSLYYLLGHKPTLHHETFGKTLFVENEDERKAGKYDNYLIASSYAAVYGVLSGDGLSLNVADGVSYKDYGFNMSSAQPDSSTLQGSAKTSNEELIRKKILTLDKFYGYTPKEESAK
jgi:phosphoglycerol transferase MdoB-like AlkP superfamily enzyme